MKDVEVFENFFDHKLIDHVWEELKPLKGEDFKPNYGVFPNQLIAILTKIEQFDNLPNTKAMLDQAKTIFPVDVTFRTVIYQVLYLPWDIHSDWDPKDGYESYYNLLIPIHDVDSRTIIFNERSRGSNSFSDYKANNPKAENPISQEFWDENLSYCWPHDREYLTLHTECPYQRKGQLVAFKRELFHSSDSFHLRGQSPKYFMQVLVDKAI